MLSANCTVACGFPRSYSLLDENGSKITVHAALMNTDQLKVTESNPLNQKTLGRAADATDDGAPYLWLDALDSKPKQLTLTQVRSLAESLTAFRLAMYDFLANVYGEIGTGQITTPEQIDHAAWPS
jgi:hypothetical protein